MKLSRLFVSGLAAIIAVTSTVPVAGASELMTDSVSVTMEAAASSGVNAAYRTQAQILSYLASHPFSTTDAITYSRDPDLTSPYEDAGALNDATLQNGLNALNVIRYVAGLDEVSLDSTYNLNCQAGAYVIALNGGLSHSPTQPAGLSDSIYQTGKAACGESNLAAGTKNLAAAVLAYMDDSDSGNIGMLGHRRWILNPTMQKTGFGQVNNPAKNIPYYSAMYAFNNYGAATSTTGVCWPAQNMPTEYFGKNQAWSYTYGQSVNISAVTVTLTRQSDGKVYHFSQSSSDGYFNVNNGNYGRPGCIIFRPDLDDDIVHGDVFNVKIDGVGTPVEYTVNFFSLDPPPAPVTKLTAETSANKALLTWNQSSDTASYVVEMLKDGKWEYVRGGSSTGSQTTNSVTVSNLEPGTEYSFRVFAKNSKGEHGLPTVVKATTKSASTPPEAVTDFKATEATQSSITLEWTSHFSATGYQIDIYKDGAWTTLVPSISGSPYKATRLNASTSYKFRIYASNGLSKSASMEITAKTQDVPPQPITGFAASSVTANSITLKWDKSDTANSYKLEMKKNGEWTVLTTTTGTSYTVTGLSPSTSYEFRISGINGTLVGSASTATSTTAEEPAPDAVTGLKASSATTSSITLTWNKVTNAASYQVDIYKNGTWTKLTDTTGTSYTATGLSAGMSYQFRVRAVKNGKYSESTTLTASTNAAAVPKPDAVTGFKASSATTNSITLTWNKATNADSYQIDIYKNGAWSTLTKTAGTSYTATGLSAGTSYQFRIFALNGSQSSSSVQTTANTKPSMVTGFTASSETTTTITLTWNKVSNADSYQIDAYLNGKWTYLTKTEGTSYTATGLSAGTSYQFRIYAFKGSQNSSYVQITADTKPSAVTGFTDSSATSSSITLTWNKVSNADSYQIYINENGTWTKLTDTTGTSYTATGLSANTSYQFRIRAVKNGKYSAWTNHTASTKAAAVPKPSAVTGFKASTITTNSITLAWNKATNADSYKLEMKVDGAWKELTTTTGTSYTVKNLSPNTSYEFRIRGVKGTVSGATTTETFTTAKEPNPDKVTGFTASSETTNSITLTWNKVSNADSYQIYINKNGTWTKLDDVTGTSYTATGLSASTSYEFRIRAVKNGKYSAWTNHTASTKAAAVTKPSAVTGFKASTITTNSITLTWNKATNADSYKLEMKVDGAWKELTTTSSTSYTVKNLSPNTSYEFRIRGVKGTVSGATTTETFTTAKEPAPDAVTGFKATTVSSSSIKLTWNKVSNADSYQIDIYKDGKWTYLTKTTGTSYTATGLSAGTSYQFHIYAIKGSQYSTSAKATGKTAEAVIKPDAVTGFKATTVSSSSIKLTWNKVSNADSYQIDIYKDGKWTYLTKTTGTSYTATGLSSGTTYQFHIYAFNGSQYSTSANATAKTTAEASSTKPSAVTGFKATTASSSSIKLTWNKVSNADSYQIDVYKDGKWTYLTKTTGTSYTATGLSSGTTYQFRIFAFKGSQYSTSVKATAKTTTAASSTKPSVVTGFKATTVSSSSINLTWNKVSNADSYQIDVYKDGKWTYLTKTTGTSYTATGLSSGTIYQFRIFAFKGSQYSTSVKATAKTTAAASSTKPSVVTGFKATTVSSSSIKLTWNKVSNADSYQIDVYKDGKWTYLTTTTGTSYTATGLSSGTIYQFRIFAFNGSQYSTSVKGTAKT